MIAGNAQITFNCERKSYHQSPRVLATRSKIRNDLVERILHSEQIDLKEIPMQERLIHIPGADYSLLLNIYGHCKQNLALYLVITHCPYGIQAGLRLAQLMVIRLSRSHTLNGCTGFGNNYVARHDRIAVKISNERPRIPSTIFINKTI